MLAFPLQEEPTGRIRAVVYHEGHRALRYGFPLEGFVTGPTGPSPTASAMPPAASS
jgi:hypothetical protein